VEFQQATSVLFVCVENAAVSIMAESILRSMSGRRFRAFSAGIRPAAEVSPQVLEFLQGRRLPTEELRPKSLAQCPRVDFVITVCPRAEASLPEDWPGDPAADQDLHQPAARHAAAPLDRAARAGHARLAITA
jgi:arsenate reductase (thioredoxin)